MTTCVTYSRRESAATRWQRRALTVPLYLIAGASSLLLLPLTVALSLLIDGVRRTPRLPTCRCVLALTLYLVAEAVGIAASAALWLYLKVHRSPARFAAHNLALQRAWAAVLFGGAARVFAMRTTVNGAECLRPGPILLFARHASTLDTLLPTVVCARGTAMPLRHVMKRELLWDPCLDIVGQRTRQVFIRRGARDRERELDELRRLAVDLGTEGILLFPEGTRFSADKLSQAGATLSSDPQRQARVGAFRHVLPPRTAGALALIDAAPTADVVFFAHTGFEGSARLSDIWRGELIGRNIAMHFWRVARTEIPVTTEARIAWLDAQWAQIDAWIERQIAGGGAAPGSRDELSSPHAQAA